MQSANSMKKHVMLREVQKYTGALATCRRAVDYLFIKLYILRHKKTYFIAMTVC